MQEENRISEERISMFLDGRDPQEGIVSIECSYMDEEVSIVYREGDAKKIRKDGFKPFLWAKQDGARRLFVDEKTGRQNKTLLKKKMEQYGITVKGLNIFDSNGKTTKRLEQGYRLIFTANKVMSYSKFLKFFKDGGVDTYDGSKEFLSITPVEQYMMRTGKRFFKGYDNYDDLIRLQFDLETQGLFPEVHRINQIGIRTNKGFEKILAVDGLTKEDRDASELEAIKQLFFYIKDLKPDVIAGHNSENFDWNFIIVRCEKLGTSVEELTKNLFRKPLYKSKKKTVLKLGGEMEYFNKTNLWGYSILDSLHAVRRAQAIDSDMKKADLKYVTKYSKLNKQNRVYVPGDKIVKVWEDETNYYAFNNENGNWYLIDEKHPLKDGYTIENGRYVVDRYLKDDLYETDKVECRYNESNFLLGKLLPTSFERVCTMGTAGIWKLIMMAWSYENGLAIPDFSESKKFTGGLSRLLRVGYVGNVVKLDYNSLYPSIILTWMIEPNHDISHVMLSLLNYILTQREKYKDLKGVAGKKLDKCKEELKLSTENSSEWLEKKKEIQKWENEKNSNDKKQLPFKIFANSFFGGFGAPNLFPWGDVICAEKTTCCGRQSLRLMIKWFTDKGYAPIVGDSVTYDTPVYIKYNNGDIDIKAISELFSESEANNFGNEQMRDFSLKPYQILTRNGWKNINYVYRHKTNKKIHRIETKDRMIDVTSDHSLFRHDSSEVKPKDLVRNDKIEVYNLHLNDNKKEISLDKAWLIGLFIGDGSSVSKERKQKYFSKKNNCTHYNKGIRRSWKISNTNLDILNKAKIILKKEYNVDANIKDHLKSSGVYNLKTENSIISEEFSKMAYTNYRFKKIPSVILNSSNDIKLSFLDGFMAADGYGMTLDETESIGQKSQVTMAGLSLILKDLNLNYRLKTRKDKENFITFNLKNRHGNKLDDNYSNKETDTVWNNSNIKNPTEYVYDVSTEDGTFIAGIGCITAHNTDGFNFQLPKTYRYTDENPYISTGLGRNYKKGDKFTKVEADVAEFEDLFLRGKMGLGIDEYADATINFSRKNYSDLLSGGKIKYVGNTIKSKRMPAYIEKFMETGIKFLLNGKGKEFLEFYYEYIEKIYDYKIPLRDIASKGKIKKSIEEYKKDCHVLTKAGRPKSRQVWYELCLKNNYNPDIAETIYYINIGDGKKKTTYKDVEKKNIKGKDGESDTFEIRINCVMLDPKTVEADEDTFCTEDLEYNAPKYIEAFNNRIKPLLVCFSPDIRSEILIKSPDDKKSFTDKQCELSSGFPNKIEDQDTYEQLMTMDDKEIKYWISVDEIPPFVNEINMDWENVVKDYNERMEKLKEENIALEVKKYNEIIDKLTKKEVDDFIIEVKIPKSISSFLKLDASIMKFVSKLYDIPIGSIYDIADKEFDDDNEDEESGEE